MSAVSPGKDHLPQRGARADVDAPVVVRALRVREDPRPFAELPADLLDHRERGAADCADGHGGEEERDARAR